MSEGGGFSSYGSGIGSTLDEDGNPIGGLPPATVVTNAQTIADQAAELELDLLASQQNRLNELQDAWRNTYKGCELNTLTEVSNVPIKTVNIPTISASAIGAANQYHAQASQDVHAMMGEHCISDKCGLDSRLAIQKVKSTSWQIQGDLRYAEVDVELKNADRLNARIAMINPGRSNLVNAANSLAAAAKISGEAARAAAAASAGGGYLQGRLTQAAVSGLQQLAKSDFVKDMFAPSVDQNDGSFDRVEDARFARYGEPSSIDSNSSNINFQDPMDIQLLDIPAAPQFFYGGEGE